MVQAAVDGVVDYREARLEDPHWMLRLTWLLAGLARRNHRDQCRTQLSSFRLHWTALFGADNTARLANSEISRLQEEFDDSFNLVPSPKLTAEERDKAVARTAITSWEEAYGKLDDPDTQAKTVALAKAMKALMDQTAAEYGADGVTDPRQRLQNLMYKPKA